jgi:hypothetical protein
MSTAILFCAVMLAADNPAQVRAKVLYGTDQPLSEQSKKRAKVLKANAKTFRLELNYNGPEDKPYYRLILSVPKVGGDRRKPFYRIVQLKEDEALKVIDHLARDGFLDNAIDLLTDIKISVFPSKMPGYMMKVDRFYEDLRWGLSMIQRLDGLRDVLPDASKKDMDFLLGRLSGLRKRWEAEQPTLDAKVGRKNSRVRFVTEDDKTIIDITSEFGIDKATISRKSDEWPKSILVRLHLSGLESFRAGDEKFAVEWSVSSTGQNAKRVSLRKGRDEVALDDKSPYFTEVRIVADKKKIPLKGGYFEVPLPVKLFDGNPDEITLRWIDFYRN